MLPTLSNLPGYSVDIWDYLPDMPYMPSRKERDGLLKDVETEPSAIKRVRLWDYFFRIRPEDVGKPQSKELSGLEREANDARRRVSEQTQKLENERTKLIGDLERLSAEGQKYATQLVSKLENERTRLIGDREKLIAAAQRQFSETMSKLEMDRSALNNEINRYEKERQQQELGAEQLAIQKLEGGFKGKRTWGTISTIIALLFFLVSCISLISYGNSTQNNPNPDSFGLIMPLLCGATGLPFMIFAGIQFVGARRPSSELIAKETSIQIEMIRQRYGLRVRQPIQSVQQISTHLEQMKAQGQEANSPARRSIDQLTQNIQNLTIQIRDASTQASVGMTSSQQKQIQQLTDALDQIPAKTEALKKDFETSYLPYEQRMQFLKQSISDLMVQIPSPVSDEQVNIWLMEDIEDLAETATSRSGLRDRLIHVLNAENPYCIRGPAELQLGDLIPAPFRDKNSDRFKHLRARQFVIMPDKTFADFYGVYNIEFILVAEDVLATYGTFYDFITGRQSGERTTGQHYADVVMIRTNKGYREVETDNNETISMENVPALSLSLVSGDKIEVTFPDGDYFKQIRARGFGSARWRFDPGIAAENAIKIVREKVDIAKKQK